MLNSDIRRDDRGVDRCCRTVMQAVHNVPNDDSKGFHNVASTCNMPIVQRISDGVKGCPRCDKEPPVGNVHPRVTNAAAVTLTQKELEECGVTEDTSKIERPKQAVKAEAKIAVEAKMSEIKKDEISLTIALGDLESDRDIAAFLIKQASEALDTLPVTNFKESKRLIRLQEKLESLLKV